ncbi:MAG TPA: winged helix DNA-binding domain-containing protein [Glycomyces sp.]|nr:winged helix DNA-binding domain-containing protein [Glycomyces sp.]
MTALVRRSRDPKPGEIAAWRAHSQRLWGEKHATPMEAFAHLGAVQSQEVLAYRLTPAMRAAPTEPGAPYAPLKAVDALIEDGTVLRTHVLRTTWHTVPAVDLRMMLAATADRVLQVHASTARSLGLDQAVLVRGDEILADAARGRHLTREEASEALAEAGVADPTGQRLIHMLMHAELTEAICSGTPRDGKQTYAAFEERVPPGVIDRETAIRELARRFYTSRGPATVKDFTRWSSLKVADAKAAIADLDLESIDLGGRTCYFGVEPPEADEGGPVVDFVQGFDEMLCSYTDTKDWVLHHTLPIAKAAERPRFNSVILLDGQLVGHWKATVKAEKVVIDSYRHRGFTAAEIAAMRRGADRLRTWYGKDEMELGLGHA